MRTDEMIARADRYRLAQQARKASEPKKQSPRTSRVAIPVYRRVLAAFGLSIMIVLATAALALARPMGPGPSSESDGSSPILRRQGPIEQFQPAPAVTEQSDSEGIPALATGAIVGLVIVTGTMIVILRHKQEPSTV